MTSNDDRYHIGRFYLEIEDSSQSYNENNVDKYKSIDTCNEKEKHVEKKLWIRKQNNIRMHIMSNILEAI